MLNNKLKQENSVSKWDISFLALKELQNKQQTTEQQQNNSYIKFLIHLDLS